MVANKKKKWAIILCVTVAVLCLAVLFSACNNSGSSSEGEGEKKTDEHVHSDACWQKGTSVRGNCQTYGYTEYQCAVTGEVKKEYDTEFGDHEYVGHVCRICGTREKSSIMWNTGSVTAYLYVLTTDLSGGNDTYWFVVDGKGAMASYSSAEQVPWSKYVGQIVRAEVCDGVTELGDHFMTHAVKLTDLKLGSTIQKVGAYAFTDCPGLTTLSFGNALTSVGKYAFSDCTGLTSCSLPGKCEKVGECAFSGCTALRSLAIANIGSEGNKTTNRFFGSIFSENVGLDEDATQVVEYEGETFGFVLPSKLYDITFTGNFAAEPYVCFGTSVIRSITFTGNVTTIGEYAFASMPDLGDLVFESNSLTAIDDYAFKGDASLGSKKKEIDENGITIETDRLIFLPSSLQTMGNGAFLECSTMEHLEMGDTHLTEIPKDAFNGCAMLQSVTLPETLEKISISAFELTALEKIVIPASVKSVLSNAFKGCAKLSRVYVNSADVYHIERSDPSGLFAAADRVYVLAEAIDDDPKVTDDSCIKRNFRYRGIGEDTNGYYLWMK